MHARRADFSLPVLTWVLVGANLSSGTILRVVLFPAKFSWEGFPAKFSWEFHNALQLANEDTTVSTIREKTSSSYGEVSSQNPLAGAGL